MRSAISRGRNHRAAAAATLVGLLALEAIVRAAPAAAAFLDCDGLGGTGNVRCPAADDLATKVCVVIVNGEPVVGTYNRQSRTCFIPESGLRPVAFTGFALSEDGLLVVVDDAATEVTSSGTELDSDFLDGAMGADTHMELAFLGYIAETGTFGKLPFDDEVASRFGTDLVAAPVVFEASGDELFVGVDLSVLASSLDTARPANAAFSGGVNAALPGYVVGTSAVTVDGAQYVTNDPFTGAVLVADAAPRAGIPVVPRGLLVLGALVLFGVGRSMLPARSPRPLARSPRQGIDGG